MTSGATPAPAATASRFPLRPVPRTAGACPRCERPLDVHELHFPGSRSVLEGDCGGCRHRYLQDLPTGHGVRYPGSVDLTTGETWGQWVEAELVGGGGHPDGHRVSLEADIRQPAANPVLLNCLDFVYGHALLRLFNATRHIDQSDEDLVLLIPDALSALVPDGAAEVWTVHEPLTRLRGWLLDLDERVAAELDRFERCTLSPAFAHPHPSTFELERFTGTLPARRQGEPSIAFVLREERLWGRDADDQARLIEETWRLLAERVPSAGAAIVGVGTPRTWPAGIDDFRKERRDVACEREWLGLLSGADLAIGVHGSNMLLPSGLSRATIELLPAG